MGGPLGSGTCAAGREYADGSEGMMSAGFAGKSKGQGAHSSS